MRDTRQRLLDLADTLEPSIARAFVRAVQSITSPAQLALIAAAIKRGDAEEVFRILQIRPESFGLLDDAFRAVFIQGAAYQIDSVPKKQTDPQTGARLIVRFGGSQPRAQQIIGDFGARLIAGLVEGQRETITETIAKGVEAGKGSQAIALDLIGRKNRVTGLREGGVIGLSPARARTVADIERAFLTGDIDRMRDYLRFGARDKRYDRTVVKAIKEGKALSKDRTRTIVGRLSEGYLRRRGEAIARSETIPALNAGRRESIQQMIDRGVIRPWQVTRVWDATGDARTRLDHLRMEDQTVEWGQPFIAPDGSQLMGPGDTSLGASASQTVNCRCYENIRVDWLAAAR